MLGRIRKYLDERSTEQVVHAFITSRLDSCNSLLIGLPDNDVQKLQRLQNASARLVTRSKCNEHITPVLKHLHWLPVSCRIQYKLLLLIFKTLNLNAPAYLEDLISRYVPSRPLRSSSHNDITSARIPRTDFYGKRAFAVSAPELWNCLPVVVKTASTLDQFKCRLKTFLFEKYFTASAWICVSWNALLNLFS